MKSKFLLLSALLIVILFNSCEKDDNLRIEPTPLVPTITGFIIPAKVVGDDSFNLTPPTSNSSGVFTYTSSNTAVATISDNTVTIVAEGTTTIKASQAANGNFLAGDISDDLVVTAQTTPVVGTLYVSTTGNDSNNGSKDSPFLTINKAAQIAVAGDNVCIKSGTYKPTVVIKPANSGTELAPITYYAEEPGKAIIDGQSSIPTIASREGLFFVSGKSHIVIDGLRIINSGFFGILIKDNSSNVIVKNCSTYNTGASGICGANASFIKVLNNSVQRACIAPGGQSVRTSECITMASVNTFEVAYNTVFDRLVDVNNGGEGIDTKNACVNGKVHHNTVYDLIRVGLYIDSYKSALNNVEFYSNTVYNCSSGLNVACEEGGTNTNVKVYNNVIYNCPRVGIRLAGYLSDGAMYNISVYNNTVSKCGFGGGTWENCGLLVEASNVLNTNFIVRNNIFSGNKIQMKTKNQSWLTLDNNLIFGANDASGTGTNTIIGDPLFVNALENNFRLKAGSPAIDKALGTPKALFDFTDFTRDATPDIGAFEYH
jgi:hypothetical protein